MSDKKSEQIRVLVVEDDGAARVGLQQLIRGWGFDVETAADGEEALQKSLTFRPVIVVTDLVMPKMGGLELLRGLQQQGDHITTILLTAQGTVETAVEAIKQGAYDYLTKPVDLQRLKILLAKVVERHETLREVRMLRQQLREHGTFGALVGSSPEMRKIYHVIEQAAPTSASVLISGESGTGKELVAQTIHRLSPRTANLRAAQLRGDPDMLLESNCSATKKGVHGRHCAPRRRVRAGASRTLSRRDRGNDAHHAGEAARPAGAFVPALGGSREQSVDIRVIAATNLEPATLQVGCAKISSTGSTSSHPAAAPGPRTTLLLAQAFIKEFDERHRPSLASPTRR
jgi:DNA-binding NtrC family response regulator